LPHAFAGGDVCAAEPDGYFLAANCVVKTRGYESLPGLTG